MKIFISWSGNRSKAVAELIADWIKCVLQASHPWVSTRDIDRGSLWFSEINNQLRDTSAGIVCLTQENKNNPWILFEAGALAKGLTSNRVCTFLVDLETAEVEDPLAQFNHTLPDKDSMWKLVRVLNQCLADHALDDRVLDKVFTIYWPQFEAEFSKALDENQPTEKIPQRSESDILAEILNNTRSMNHRVREIESKVGGDPFPLTDVDEITMPAELRRKIRNLLNEGYDDCQVLARIATPGMPISAVRHEIKKMRDVTSMQKTFFDPSSFEHPRE